MKNRFCLFILVALCFVTVLTSAASAKDYTVSDTDLTISIDDSYWYVFTRDNIEGNPELDELGITYDYIHGIMMEKKFISTLLLHTMTEAFLSFVWSRIRATVSSTSQTTTTRTL